MPMNLRLIASSSTVRRSVSPNSELPPSIMMSPSSRNGISSLITASTGAPALTIISILRGRSREATNSAIVNVPLKFFPAARVAKNLSVLSRLRL